ncbi:MAG TPA: DUF167 domain-containing protein [Pirellulaceae bacterium]|nr:DUF167 domain-containing protein [Pirellulaceae bacterium]
MIEISDHPAGVVVPVRAQPGASSSGIRGEQGGALKVAVTQTAEKGKANEALIDTLAEKLRLKRSQIELVSGATQRSKKVLFRSMSREELQQRIARALEE